MTSAHLTSRQRRNSIAIAVFCLLAATPTLAQADEKADSGFTPLFNGKNLSGWQTTDNWAIQPDGVLTLNPKSRRKRLIPDHQSFLWTTATYDNFTLDLEYKIQRGGSSGVFLRSTSTRSYLQVQIRDSHGQRQLGNDTAGAVVDVAAPKKNMSKPAGEWNRMSITCDKNRMLVQLNGDEVVNLDLAKSPKTSSIRAGRIGLENANNPVEFRNVRLKKL
jgi:hypothetical protein